MQKLGKISVLGGDARIGALAAWLAQEGADVFVCGREDHPAQCHCVRDVRQALADTSAVILPIPSFIEERYVYGMQEALSPEVLFAAVGGRCPVFGARLSEGVRSLAVRAGVRLIDYAELETVQLKNAVVTAEGALYLAMQALDITLDGARAAVLGYGRIGRVLARLLRDLGADVSVAVRSKTDVVRLQTEHYTPIVMVSGEEDSLLPLSEGYDVIFNTVPHRLLSTRLLTAISPRTLLIELAGAPGGWNPDDAAKAGNRVVYAPGLPGKYAPRTAGQLLAQGLLPYLRGEVPLP